MKTLLIIFSKKGIRKIVFGSSHIPGREGAVCSCSLRFEVAPMNIQPPLFQDCRKHPSKKYFTKTVSQLTLYFSRKLKRFQLPLDLQGTGFDMAVWKVAQKIPYGEVRTYKDIAKLIGKPLASRAVGNALGRNPIPILVPCHRVIASNGTLGGYSSGLKIKKTLLSLEKVSIGKN